MSDFNYTIQLAQTELDDLKNRLTTAKLQATDVMFRPAGATAVKRVPYDKRKYKTVSAGEADSLVNREVF